MKLTSWSLRNPLHGPFDAGRRRLLLSAMAAGAVLTPVVALSGRDGRPPIAFALVLVVLYLAALLGPFLFLRLDRGRVAALCFAASTWLFLFLLVVSEGTAVAASALALLSLFVATLLGVRFSLALLGLSGLGSAALALLSALGAGPSAGALPWLGQTILFIAVAWLLWETRRWLAATESTWLESNARLQSELVAREAAAEARRQAEKRYRELFDAAPVLYVITEARGGAPTIVDCNRRFYETLGYDPAEVLERPLSDILSHRTRVQLEQGGYRRALSGAIAAEECQLVAADGRVLDAMLHVEPSLTAHGQAGGMLAMFVDVTALQTARDTARRVELIHAANLALTQSLDLDYVLETLLDFLADLIPYDSANVLLRDDETRFRVHVTRRGRGEPDPRPRRAITFDAATNQIFARLVETRTSILIDNTTVEAAWERPPEADDVRCWLGVPLVVNGELIGLFSVNKFSPNFFTPEHQEIAEALASQAAVATHNARFHRQVQKEAARLAAHVDDRDEALALQERRQSALRALKLAVTRPGEMQATIDQIVAFTRAHLPADHASLILWDEAEQRYFVSATTVTGQESQSGVRRVRKKGGATRWILDNRQPVIVRDVRHDPFGANQMLVDYDLRAYAGVPIMAEDRILGVLYALDHQPRDYTAAEIDFMTALTRSVGVALEHVRLFDALRASEARLRAVITSAPVLLFTLDGDGRFTLADGQGLQRLNRATGSPVGAHFGDVFGDSPALAAAVEAALTGRTLSIGVDVANVNFDVWLSPLHGDKGDVHGVIGVAVDITRRREAERQSEVILETAMDGFLVVDADGRILEANAAYCALSGYSRADLRSMMIVDVVAAQTLDEVRQHNERARRKGYTRYEARHRARDGRLVDLEISVNYLPFETGRFMLFLRDVSERKRAEQERTRLLTQTRAALQRTEALFNISKHFAATQQLTDMLPALVDKIAAALPADRVLLLRINMESRQATHFVKGGPGAAETTVMSMEDVWDGLSGWVLEHGQPVLSPRGVPDDRESPVLQQRRLDQNAGAIIVAPLTYQGEILGTLTAINRLEAADFTADDVDLMMAIANQTAVAIENARLFETVQARTRQLEALREIGLELTAELDLTALLQSISARAMQFLDGDASALYLHQAADDQLELAITTGTSALSVGSRLDKGEGLSGKIWAANSPRIVGDYNAWPNRVTVSPALRASVIGVPITAGRTFLGVLNVASDELHRFGESDIELLSLFGAQAATAIRNARLHDQIQRHSAEMEQRVAERTSELMAANERLLELDHVKTKFIDDVSHELRTPLASISLYHDLLGRKPERLERYLAVLDTQTERLGQLVEGILNMTRLDLNTEEMQRAPLDMNQLVEQVLDGYMGRAEAAGLDLRFEPGKSLPLVDGSDEHLARVIRSLVTNALNYTPEGEVVVSTHHAATRGEVIIRVADTGIGIADEDIDHLFDRFYRGRGASQSSLPGIGLGLSTAREIMSLHQGDIRVRRDVERGAVFEATLPVAPADVASPSGD